MHNPTSGGQQVAGRTPTLIIPSDPTKWREMQRSLVVGGVYHVQTAGSQGTQYCLWNGTQLVPCKYGFVSKVSGLNFIPIIDDAGCFCKC